MTAPIPGVTYIWNHAALEWQAPGREPIAAAPVVEPPVVWSTSKVPGGLVVVDDARLSAVGAPVDHIFLKVPWSTINPSAGVYNWSFIDNALSTSPNAKFTLRIQAGDTAPGWLKTLTGTVECYNAARNITVFPCKWWTPTARNAWQSMINAAGVRYDANPRVVMVSADLPMVVYSEPYILGNDSASAIRLYTAGLTKSVHIDTIAWCVDATAAAFPNTLVELAIHSDLQYPTATGIARSWPEGRALAVTLANRHGRHLAFSDYGLGTADTLAAHTPTGTITTEADVYAWMYLRSLEANKSQPWAGPVTFQLTVGTEPQTQETYRQAAQNAIDLGGQMCETAGWGLLGSLAPGLDTQLKQASQRWIP